MEQSQLNNLVRIGHLKEEAFDPEEVEGLIHSGDVRLQDACNPALSRESRFDLAYNASHALSLAALRLQGYRSENRYLVFQCLQVTLDIPAEQWRVLDQAHRKRNLSEYEGVVDVDEELLDAMIRVALEVLRKVREKRV